MRAGILFAVALASLSLNACVQNYADREIRQGAESSELVVLNAPVGSTVSVNGSGVGSVQSARSTFPLSPGRQQVQVLRDNRVIFQQVVMAAPGATIEVRIP